MRITAIIPTMEKNKDYLKLCVESLRRTVDWDIVVVSNGGHNYPIKDIYGMTRRLHTSTQGQCNAVNIGAQTVSPNTDYLFISNDDMYYAPDWNKNLNFNNLVFSPNLVEPENNAGSALPFLKLDAGYTLDEFDGQKVNEFVYREAIMGNLPEDGFNFPVFIRKDVWDTIGGYDTEYDPWGSNSDTDLQTKIALAGITPVRLRDVLVYHFSNKSGTFDGTHQAEWQHNFDYYTAKWGFNRDTIPTDVWYHKNLIDYDNLLYHPNWEGKFNG